MKNKRALNPIDHIVAKRIRLIRLERGVSLEWLAQRIGISYQQVQKYEAAKNRVTASRLFLISQALGVPLDYFYYGAKEAAKKMSRWC